MLLPNKLKRCLMVNQERTVTQPLWTGIQLRPGITVVARKCEKARPFQKNNSSRDPKFYFGCCIIAKLEFVKTIAIECVVHPYKRSTTNEKLNVVSEYEERKIEKLILHYSRNNVFKHHRKIAQKHFAVHTKLVKNVLIRSNKQSLLYAKFLL